MVFVWEDLTSEGSRRETGGMRKKKSVGVNQDKESRNVTSEFVWFKP